VELGHRQIVPLGAQRGAELDVRTRVRRIERDGALEQDDRAIERLEALRLAIE
jgi:hypothetical protein